MNCRRKLKKWTAEENWKSELQSELQKRTEKVNCKVNCRSVVELRNEPEMKNGVGVYLRATVRTIDYYKLTYWCNSLRLAATAARAHSAFFDVRFFTDWACFQLISPADQQSRSHYWICLQLIWLTGWETLCANYMAMSIWFALLERCDIRSTFDETIIWIWLRYRYVHLRSKLSLFLQTKKRCYGQVSNSVHMKQVETITFILFSFACVRIQSACIIIIIMMTFRWLAGDHVISTKHAINRWRRWCLEKTQLSYFEGVTRHKCCLIASFIGRNADSFWGSIADSM